MNTATKLTNLQVELVKVFSYDLPEYQLLELKELLAKYFADKATNEMDNLWEERGWSNETMKELSNTHLRTPYKP